MSKSYDGAVCRIGEPNDIAEELSRVAVQQPDDDNGQEDEEDGESVQTGLVLASLEDVTDETWLVEELF